VSELSRGAVRLHILHHAGAGAIHGAWMSQELTRHGYQISPGTLYSLLHRMQGAGLLASRKNTVEGRAQPMYTLTHAGRAELVPGRAALAELAREVLGCADLIQAP
jgi:DNA-binding PadR family transcriptional regulator